MNLENAEKVEKRKSETICCNTSRRANNQNLIRNLLENENIDNINSSLHGIKRIYRNSGNNLSISDNHSTSMVNTRPYVKIDKYLLKNYVKNSNNNKEPYLYQNKIKNLKNASCGHSKDKNINLRNNINIPNNNNNSYILDPKAQDEIISKFMIDDNSLINSKKIYNRHKSIENNSHYIKGKQMNIKKMLISNNTE